MGLVKLGDALAGCSQGLPEVGSAVAVAGILMGAFDITGLGFTISQELVSLAGGNLIVLVVITAIACIVLGMGLSAVAVYLLAAIFLAPALTTMGVAPLAAHFFVVWMAGSAVITPPVCAAAYLAGAIAGAPLMATGWQACRLAIVVYLMSISFVLAPALLMIGDPSYVWLALGEAIVGVYFLSCGVSGRMLQPASWLERILFLGGGMLFIITGAYNGLVGLALVALPAFFQITGARLWKARIVRRIT